MLRLGWYRAISVPPAMKESTASSVMTDSVSTLSIFKLTAVKEMSLDAKFSRWDSIGALGCFATLGLLLPRGEQELMMQ
jgi:hypothetical protein